MTRPAWEWRPLRMLARLVAFALALPYVALRVWLILLTTGSMAACVEYIAGWLRLDDAPDA